MKHKLIAVLGLAAVSTIMTSGVSIMPAEARGQCIFVATTGGSWAVATQGTARRQRTACRRAKRRCIRKVNRAERRGQFGRGEKPRCRQHSWRGASF